jgi:SAM-dependent methyltransferase
VNPQEYRTLAAVESTHWWYRSLHALVDHLIDRHASVLPSRPRILDAGCGTGFVARSLAARGPVAAIDVSEYATDLWNRSPCCRVQFARASVSALPFAEESFDLVVSLDVLYHRAVGDDAEATRELARVLRPGGLILLNLPAYNLLQSSHDRAIHTARRYTRRRVRELLETAEVTPLTMTHWNTLLFPLAAAARLWGRLRPSKSGSDVHPVSPWLNEAFRSTLALERGLIRRMDLAYGLSIIAVGQKSRRDR